MTKRVWLLWPGFFFVRSGSIAVGYGRLRFAGIHGWWWSSTAATTAKAYRLYFDAADVYPPNDSIERFNGSSLRCLAD